MVAYVGGALERFNEAYNIGNFEDAKSALKSVDFPYTDEEAQTQLKNKYSQLLNDTVYNPSPNDLDVKINLLAMFFLSQIPVIMRKSFVCQLNSRIEEINKRIKEIETPLPEEQYKIKKKVIYQSSDFLPARMNAGNFHEFRNAENHPTFECEKEETHTDHKKLERRLNGDLELANRKELKDRLSIIAKQALPDRIISSDFDIPQNILTVLDKEGKAVTILKLNGNEIDQKILIDIIDRIDQTSLRTLNLSSIAWTCDIANHLADKLRKQGNITTLTIGESAEYIEPEISKLLLSALVENDSIKYLNIPNSTFLDSSQPKILSEIEKRNLALARVRQGRHWGPGDPAPMMFADWGQWFAKGDREYVPKNLNQSLKWYVEAAELAYVPAIRKVTIYLAGNIFDPNTIKRKLESFSLSSIQLQQWIEISLKFKLLTEKKRPILTYNLGQLYENEMIGIPNDRDKKVASLYRKAAEDGLVEAQMAFAKISEQGKAEPKECIKRKIQAKFWYYQAFLQGNKEALIEVQRLKEELRSAKKHTNY